MDSLHTITIGKRRKRDLQFLKQRYKKLKYELEQEKLLDNETAEYLLSCIEGIFTVINYTKNKKDLDI